MEEYPIEELGKQNYDELREIFQKQQKYHYDLEGPFANHFLEISVQGFKEEIAIKDNVVESVVYVVRNQEKTIIAFIGARMDKKQNVFIPDLYVEEEYRDQKLGKKLMKKALDWAMVKKAKSIDLHVSMGNEKAIHFYEKFGFHQTDYRMKKVFK